METVLPSPAPARSTLGQISPQTVRMVVVAAIQSQSQTVLYCNVMHCTVLYCTVFYVQVKILGSSPVGILYSRIYFSSYITL